MTLAQRPIRLVIQQPALPSYRVAPFASLAQRPGIDLTLLYGDAPDAPANVEASGFRAVFAPIRSFLGGRLLWHGVSWGYTTRRSADVLILSWNVRFLTLIPTLLRARVNGVKTVLWGHGYSKHEALWRHTIRALVAWLADALLFYNHDAAQRFARDWGYDKNRIHVALNTLDQGPIQQSRLEWQDESRRRKFRRAQGLDPGPVVLFVSRLMRENRVDLLLEAATKLIADFPSLQIVLIGSGPDAERLRALATDLRLHPHVRFLGAMFGEEQLAPWFVCSDVFCYPANIGLSLLHAFGYGLPVVTSDRTEEQNPEVEALRPNENGLVYRDGDVSSLAEVLRQVLTDPPLRQRLSQEGLLTATERFTLDRMVSGMELAVRNAIKAESAFAAAVPRAMADVRPAAGDIAASSEGKTPVARALAAESLDLAIIANANTPYRTHLHRRIAREIPQVRLWSLFTHEQSNAPWAFNAPREIRPVLFGSGETATQQDDPRRGVHEWRKGGRIISFLRERNVKVVVMLGYNDLGRLRVMRWCRRHGVRCMLWGDSNVRGDRARGLRRLAKQILVPWVLRQNVAILPCGQRGVEYFARYGADRNRMFLFPVEPDYALIENLDQRTIESVKERFGLRGDRRRIIFSGRLAEVKRCDLLVDAFVAIADHRPEWDLLIVGDGPLRVTLQDRLPERLRSRVTWTGFLSDQRDVSALYRLSDILVLPSDSDPWALVINEAAAAGLAIICTNVVGAAAELVRDGVNGRCFEPGSLGQLVACLQEFTDSHRVSEAKAASKAILAQWRRVGDPVNGLRSALRFAELNA